MQVKASGNNPHYKSKFITLGDIIAELDAKKIKFSQRIERDASGIESIITTTPDGDYAGATICASSIDPAKYGSALTYARRQSLALAFGIAADPDNDAVSTAPASVTARFSAAAPDATARFSAAAPDATARFSAAAPAAPVAQADAKPKNAKSRAAAPNVGSSVKDKTTESDPWATIGATEEKAPF